MSCCSSQGGSVSHWSKSQRAVLSSAGLQKHNFQKDSAFLTGHCGGHNACKQWHTFCGYVKHFHLFQTRQGMWKLWSNLIPQNCCFQHNDQLTRGWISYGLTGAYTHTLLSRYGVISLIHYTSGWPETQSSMCTEKELSVATHSNASTFKAESNIQKGLRTFDDAWQFFSSIHASCVWVRVQTGWRESVCVFTGKRWSRTEGWGGVTVWNCYWQADGGGRGWGCKEPRLLKSGDSDG